VARAAVARHGAELERVAQLFDGDPYIVKAIGKIQARCVFDGGRETTRTPRRALMRPCDSLHIAGRLLLNAFARMPVCGLIAHYNDTQAVAPKWAAAMMRNVLTKRLTIRGFIVSDFAARHGDFLRDMSGWVREGKVKHKEFVTEGLDSAPAAFMGLLKGANFGKQLVRVGPDKA